MDFKIRQQNDLPLSIDGQNVHVIILQKEQMAVVSEEYFDAYRLRIVKRNRPDNFAMIAFDGSLGELAVKLGMRGIKFGNNRFARATASYFNFDDFDPNKYSWRRWGRDNSSV